MKIICIGRNYLDHVNELNNEKPEEPVIFIKSDSSVLINKNPFVIPEFSNNVHHEIEVIAKICKVGKYIDKKFAHKYYNQISVGVDFTARDLQQKLKDKGLPWEKAKSFDGSSVIGKWINKEELNTVNDLNFKLLKNEQIVQQGNTNDMFHSLDEIISYVSKYFTLKIGDVIFTGTPAGVSKVNEGDKLVGFLEEKELFSIRIK
jgi:2-keto-4-pentenoate hydratase/2-oxohepta-3-ene-1,7-dioic acid hydratase in catechol pathway